MSESPSPILNALYRRQTDEAARLADAAERLTLWEAAALGEDDHVRRRLEEAPAAVNTPAPDGHTPLGLAAFFGRAHTVQLLLERGADPAQPSSNEMRVQPIHAAIAGRQAAVVQLLLERGVAVNARQQVGYTALMGAAAAGREDLVDLLLAYGADPGLSADDGKTAASVAREHAHDALARRLESNATPRLRGTPPGTPA